MKLTPLNEIRPSAYNPRLTDPARLELVKLSLAKLGFLHPVYATPEGTIVSGHQRHLAAELLGWDAVPVERIQPTKVEDEVKALNLLFNRCTNDMSAHETPDELWKRIGAGGVIEALKALPDLTGADRFPCLIVKTANVAELLKNNDLSGAIYAMNVARTASRRGIKMPVIIDDTGRIVNGAGRVMDASEKGREVVSAVVIPSARFEGARAMLNYLSMDFDMKHKYADILRYNSFRRRAHTKHFLGACFTFDLTDGKPSTHFDLKKANNRAAWARHYGTSVLDFGAGLMTDGRYLNECGVKCVSFEPYVLEDGEIDVSIERSRKVCGAFLDELEAGTRFHSIFSNAILNSIPFDEDRRKVLEIVSALATMNQRSSVYMTAPLTSMSRVQHTVHGLESKSKPQARSGSFNLGYEPNVTIGELGDRPKMQKYFEWDELKTLLGEYFGAVRMLKMGTHYAGATCQSPKAVNPQKLKEALEFEFNLPYPGNERMGLADRAVKIFGEKLKISFDSAGRGAKG